MRKLITLIIYALCFIAGHSIGRFDLDKISSPIVLRGNDSIAYRDPAVLFYNDTFYLFYTVMKIEKDSIYGYTAQSESKDLVTWTSPRCITPRSQNLNFSSPGNVIRFGNEWIMCLQTYPRPNYTVDQMPRYANSDARIYSMRSRDLEEWSYPEILKLKGDMPINKMGRMIDPYLVQDKDIQGKWWCFYKQDGVSMSYSYDLKNWVYSGRVEAGENACVMVINDEYILFHSPKNGIGMKKSSDLKHWTDFGTLITLGQKNWDWGKGRVTAATVLDLTLVNGINKYLMFFHASGPLTEEEGDFDKNSSIGIAWSDDLLNWEWAN